MGTIRVEGSSSRIRRSTELPATDEFWEEADAVRRNIEQEIRNEVIHGIKPSRPVAVAAREYLGLDPKTGEPMPESRALILGPTQLDIIDEITGQFGMRLVREIATKDWNDFLDRRHSGNSDETRARYCQGVMPFLAWCKERGYLADLPEIRKTSLAAVRGRRAQRRRRSQRRRVEELRPDLLAFIFDRAAIHLRAQLYVEWSTGGRLSSVLFGCTLGDLALTEQRQRLTFRFTKNGDDVTADLHPEAAAVLREYLQWRGGLHKRNDPLFLTHRKEPYSETGRRKGWSGNNKTAFNAMKRRAIRDLLRSSVQARRAGDVQRANQYRVDAKLVRQFTQHWLRHWFATYGMAAGMSRKSIMHQGGWLDVRSLDRYEHDVESVRRSGVFALPITAPSRGSKG
jgi:site-specific recombinase XerD